MTGTSTALDLAGLRDAFDSSFARPASSAREAGIDLIGVRLGEAECAIRLSQIAGLRSDLFVTPCPSPLPELLGIAGIGGSLAPVYDLAALLGLPGGSGRWTVLVEGGALALAFSDFAGHFRVDPRAIVAGQAGSGTPHATDLATHAGRDWPVIDIPAVVSAIRKKLPPTKSKE